MTSPGLTSVLLGIHAQYVHSPPTSSRSTSATRSPASAQRPAITSPAGPPPTTTTSNSSITRTSASWLGILYDVVTQALSDTTALRPTAGTPAWVHEQAEPVYRAGVALPTSSERVTASSMASEPRTGRAFARVAAQHGGFGVDFRLGFLRGKCAFSRGYAPSSATLG